MKFWTMAGILLFAGVGSAGAQGMVGGTGSGSVGGAASLNSATGLNASNSINTANASPSSTVGADAGPAQNDQARNPGEFVPSTFQNYHAALGLGEEAGRARPVSVVEAARLARQTKATSAAKPSVVLDKDAEGKLIVVQAKQ
jgi:hypothetical protein